MRVKDLKRLCQVMLYAVDDDKSSYLKNDLSGVFNLVSRLHVALV